MMVKRKQSVTPESLQVLAKGFVETDDTAKMFGEKAAELKKTLIKVVEERGDKDEDGHSWLEIPEPVESRGRGQIVTGFKREKRVSQFIDQAKAEAWLKKHKLWDECTEEITVREIKEESLWLLVMEERYSEEEIKDLYGENVTYALVRVTE